MSLISSFFEQNFILVYFFYGLAFFTMGLAILLESRRTSEFHLARALRPLGGFGVVHGLHEWFEMFELAEAAGATNIPGWLLLPPVRLLHLVISFTLLVIFGVRLVYANRRSEDRGVIPSTLAGAVLALLWLVAWQLTAALTALSGGESIAVGDVLTRYMLGIPGALLAAWAIFLEQREFNRRNMPQFGRALLWAAVALALYGMPGQLFTRPSPLFPSNVLNTELFWDVTGIPIQFFRATLATGMAVAFIRAMHVFELESRQRLAAARAERRAAQEEAVAVQRQARRTTEQLNTQLQLAVRNLSVLHTLARDLSATLDAEIMLQEVFPAFIHGERRVGAGMVILKDANGVPEVRVKTICHAAPEDKDSMETAAQEMGQRVIERERPGYWNQASYRDIQDSVDQPWPPDESNVRVIGIPLVRQEEVIGAMLACVFPGLPPFSARDYALFSTAARQLSAALQNAALYAETEQREKLRAQLLRQVVTAQEQERQRIARELHDGPGQTLTALGLGLAGTVTQVEHNQQAAARQLNDLKGLSTHALQELRDIIADLRPSVLDDLGLLPALRSQIQLLEERIDINAELKVTGDRRRLPSEIETIIFRIIQEALTNVAKHAAAAQAAVRLHFNPATVEIEVEDNGRGFAPAEILRPGNNRRQGWGVLGMQERASLVGGTCTIESEPGVGTTVYVAIPLTGLNRNEHGQDKATSR